VRGTVASLYIYLILAEDRLKVLESLHFFGLYLFEVVCVDMMPELPKKSLIRMVVDISLWVRNLEIGACLIKECERIDRCMRSKKWRYLRDKSLKWKLQSLESTRINF
jgi:hypothetical protein